MGYCIRDLRESRRMTQQELADKANVSRTTVAMLEANLVTNTTTKTLAKIAAALGTTVENLFFADSVQSAEQK